MLRAFAGGSMFGRAVGAAPWRVLALHGWARSHRDFDAVLSPTRGELMDAVALDLPGFGATPVPPAGWGSAEYAEALRGVLEEMADRVVVVGHSFGGRVAVHLAARYPHRVAALVLTGVPLLFPAHRPRRSPAPFRLARALHRAGLVSTAGMERARNRYGSADYRASHGVMREVLVRAVGEEYGEQLDVIRCPVELVWGDDDRVAPLSVAERAADRLTDARLTVCSHAGHLTPLSVPEVLRDRVMRSLERAS